MVLLEIFESTVLKGYKKLRLQARLLRSSCFIFLINLKERKLLEIIVVMWKIWKRRNLVVFENLFTHSLVLHNQATQRLIDIKTSNKAQQVSASTSTNVLSCWAPSPQGIIKVNWDVLVDKQLSLASFGAVAGDNEGHVLASMRMKQSLILDPFIAESLATLHAS
ncbi:hypothetical protein I3842_05G140200 [Carya illinoinensis]|uniref:Uncharacterized protein n=1 Tax=Carya illinoinensis TaxID=32201 RepID=A0A922EZC9_CARIL|nr:hypothetical protein I3842_05G140200 [Carya illinoinensis]